MIRVVLLMMVKNESKIIQRCLSEACKFVDAVFVLDTGSTDNTIDLIKTFVESTHKPYKIECQNFIDFGASRTQSFIKCKEFVNTLCWDLQNTYALLLDADHILRVDYSLFDKQKMLGKFDHYKIKQIDVSSYYNIRLIRMSFTWLCKGKTHEIWTVDEKEIPNVVGAVVQDENLFWIQDVSDGGCKSDKYERDLRLLKAGLEENDPLLNGRYHFYLGQTYFTLQKQEEAIYHYEQRIDLGGWDEETWFSMLMIVKIYKELLKKEKNKDYLQQCRIWAHKAYNFRPKRMESLYILADVLMDENELEEANSILQKIVDFPIPTEELLYMDKYMYTYGVALLQMKLREKMNESYETLLPLALDILEKVQPHNRHTALMYILSFAPTLPVHKCPEFQIHESPSTLSLYYDENEKEIDILVNETLIRYTLDKKRKSSKHVPNPYKGLCLTKHKKDTFPLFASMNGEVGFFDKEKNHLVEKLKLEEKKYIVIHSECFLEKINVQSVFLSFFRCNFPACQFNDDTFIAIFSANLKAEEQHSTLFCLVAFDKNGKYKCSSFPFYIEEKVYTGLVAFGLEPASKTAYVIYYRHQQDHLTPTFASFSFENVMKNV